MDKEGMLPKSWLDGQENVQSNMVLYNGSQYFWSQETFTFLKSLEDLKTSVYVDSFNINLINPKMDLILIF